MTNQNPGHLRILYALYYPWSDSVWNFNAGTRQDSQVANMACLPNDTQINNYDMGYKG